MTNTPAQERALLDLLIRRFDAVEVPPPGLERARMYAAGALSEGAESVAELDRAVQPTKAPPPSESASEQLRMDT